MDNGVLSSLMEVESDYLRVSYCSFLMVDIVRTGVTDSSSGSAGILECSNVRHVFHWDMLRLQRIAFIVKDRACIMANS